MTFSNRSQVMFRAPKSKMMMMDTRFFFLLFMIPQDSWGSDQFSVLKKTKSNKTNFFFLFFQKKKKLD